MSGDGENPTHSLNKRSFSFDFKKIESDGEFSGYGSVFNNVDFYNEVVVPGAFAKSLRQHKKEGRLPALLWQHDMSEPIGVYSVMKEDDHGLYVEGKLFLNANVPNADKAYTLMKGGALSGLSIGFMTKVHEYDKEKGIRYLKELDLWETSLVTFPANTAARVTGVKSLSGVTVDEIHFRKRDIEAALRDAGASISVAQFVAAQIGKPALRDEVGEALNDKLDRAINILRG